jgi:hypothetical protein
MSTGRRWGCYVKHDRWLSPLDGGGYFFGLMSNNAVKLCIYIAGFLIVNIEFNGGICILQKLLE